MCYVVDDIAKVWDITTPRARKSHWCHECYAETILPGQQYERVGTLFDGHWRTYRLCLSCVSLRDAVEEHEIAEGCGRSEAIPPMGELWDAAWESGIVTPKNRWDDLREEALEE